MSVSSLPSSQEKTLLHHFFEQSASRFPEHTAIEIPPSEHNPKRQSWTYAAVESLANTLSHTIEQKLSSQAVTSKEPIVVVMLDRHTVYLYIAQLAILKAGAAYTCIDPSFPDEQLLSIIEDSQSPLLLSDAKGQTRCKGIAMPKAAEFFDIDTFFAESRHLADTISPSTKAPPSEISPERLAYVIYTSGTTGRPKGVMIEHRNIVNLIASDVDYFQLSPHERVGQSSSAAYDSSIEEIYLAFSSGSTLVVMDDETARLGPDLIPWLQKERISVFCPPPTLLRSTLCPNPEEALPDLKLLYVGGEALTEDIVKLWAPGRWLENGYGPTECAVTVTRDRIIPGKPITIGTAVRGNQAWILDDGLEEVEDKVSGELCIGGASVARGYLGRPKLTKEKFFEHPRLGRLYRTGDSVQRLPSGDLLYLGRIDSQVKLRGYRIELGAIESRLCECDGVSAAAVCVQGDGAQARLVAFIVSSQLSPQEDSKLLLQSDDEDQIRDYLQKTLPSYMVPAQFALIKSLPVNERSGKLVREKLPLLKAQKSSSRSYVAPRNPVEEHIAKIISRCLGLETPASVKDDFFDLGGTSITAAQVISELRRWETTMHLAVRDIYKLRTVAALAEWVEISAQAKTKEKAKALGNSSKETERDTPRSSLPAFPKLTSLAQLLWILGTTFGGAVISYVALIVFLPYFAKSIGVVGFLLLLPLFGFAISLVYPFIALAFAVTIKKLLIGSYQAGRYPVWGSFFIRYWITQFCVRLIPWLFLDGTHLKTLFLRALGARIGKDVYIHHGVECLAGGWDLLEIGDNVHIGRDSALRMIDYQARELVVGPIVIEKDCTIDTRAGLAAHSKMEEGSYLGPLSFLPPHQTLPAGEHWEGVPATFQKERTLPTEETTSEASWSPIAYDLVFLSVRFLFFLLPLLPLPLLGVILLASTSISLKEAASFSLIQKPWFIPFFLILYLGSVFLTLLVQAWFVRLLGRIRPGTYPLRGWTAIRVWLKIRQVEIAGNLLSGSLYWPIWLRWAGMKVGPKCEISTIMEVIPELVELQQECFFADGIYVGGPLYHRQTLTCGMTSFGQNTFLGNHCVIPQGSRLPSDILLGVSTVAKQEEIREGSSWFGHPPFELPHREVVESDRSLTHEPSFIRYLNRLFWETLRFFLPIVPLAVAFLLFQILATLYINQSSFWGFTIAMLAYFWIVGAALSLLVWAMKWFLLGKMREGQHPLWSCWCSRWDFLYVLWRGFAQPFWILFEESLWINQWLRTIGVSIGKHVVLGRGFAQVVDPDMLHFGDGSTVASLFQAHSFEDRVLKIAPVHIQAQSTVASGTVVMYGTQIGEGARVREHSVIMKQEALLPHGDYIGCPTRPIA